ncbi:MAG: TonB-dependent receptor, partial [Candidatus Didemnitutus sp.]|nr:TonB-dependent receptor [Candidatus Didemnitutus sp.]
MKLFSLPSISIRLVFAVLAGIGGTGIIDAQTTLPNFVVLSSRVANQSSAGTIDMPVSGLRFEPRVDVQGRNLAEAQADVAIRGGIFENTGFRIGAAALSDPQTGHYLVELPIAPAMLLPPAVVTGLANAASGFNAGVGTISYGWRPIELRGELSAAFGNHAYNRQSFYQGAVRKVGDGHILGADLEVARSESEGSVPFGDHDFDRIGARLQWRGPVGQTDLFAGYQAKFFGWPNLYTPFGFNETENLQTVLVALNHQWRDARGNEFAAALFYRRNKDDYEFNRAVPGASNPFQHTTWLRGASLNGIQQLPALVLNYSADVSSDRLESTALTFGRYSSRTLTKVTLVPELTVNAITARAGASLDHSNRNPSAFSPLAGVEWRVDSNWTIYGEFSEATQLPTYTALNSNAAAGLFRGNANLDRTESRNLEFGMRGEMAGWQLAAALFRREDDHLVDWTFRQGVIARTANPVDVRTTGVEFIAIRRAARYEIVAGYSWLRKRSDYGAAVVDGSFYALNFP